MNIEQGSTLIWLSTEFDETFAFSISDTGNVWPLAIYYITLFFMMRTETNH